MLSLTLNLVELFENYTKHWTLTYSSYLNKEYKWKNNKRFKNVYLTKRLTQCLQN